MNHNNPGNNYLSIEVFLEIIWRRSRDIMFSTCSPDRGRARGVRGVVRHGPRSNRRTRHHQGRRPQHPSSGVAGNVPR